METINSVTNFTIELCNWTSDNFTLELPTLLCSCEVSATLRCTTRVIQGEEVGNNSVLDQVTDYSKLYSTVQNSNYQHFSSLRFAAVTIIILKLWSGHRDPNQQQELSGSAQWECFRGYLGHLCWIFQHSFMNPVSFDGKFLISSKYYSWFGGNEEDFSANFQVNEDLYFPLVQCPRYPLCQQQSANWVGMSTLDTGHILLAATGDDAGKHFSPA